MSKTSASFRARLMGGAAAAVLMISAGSAAAQEVAKFDIAPQPLADALKQFGYQSGHGVLASPALADAKVSRGVAGEQDVEIALNQLLDGSGLTWKRNGDTFLIVSASAPQSGSAAGGGAEAGTVQALIVTAQKREENIQDVPIAMSAFTQEDLTKSQVAGGPDLMTQVPNFTFTKTNFTGYSIQIRGIGTQAISATTDPAVAVAFNNTPFIRNHFFEQEFFDLERAEVLRGPQGTLYGRNATAGVVNLISAKPKSHFEAKLSADVSNYNSTRFEGMINLPLATDKVALRIAGEWTKRDGFVKNILTGQQTDGRDLWSTRTTLKVAPTDSFTANLIWEHFAENDDRLRSGKQLCNKDPGPAEINGVTIIGDVIEVPNSVSRFSQGCKPASLYSPDSYQTPNGFALKYYGAAGQIGSPVYTAFDPYLHATQSSNLREIETHLKPEYTANSDTVELQLQLKLSNELTLASETGFNKDLIFSFEDFNRFDTTPNVFIPGGENTKRSPNDAGGFGNRYDIVNAAGIFCDPQLGCTNRLAAGDLSTAKSQQFSQEFRLSSDFDGPFNFNLGANFLRYDTEDKYYVFINSLTAYMARENNSPWGAPFTQINTDCFDRETPATSQPGESMRGYAWSDPNTYYRVDHCGYIDPNDIHHLNDEGRNYFLSKNPYHLLSYAAFGEAYYNITPDLKLTAGFRWTVDKKTAPQIPSWLLAMQSYGLPTRKVIDQEWREPTGRLAVDWRPKLSFTDQTLVYASYVRGYKAGGANPPPPITVIYFDAGATALFQDSLTHPETFKPEFVNAYEVGSKNTLLDGRLTLNLAGFYYDYTGYQISEIVDRSAVNSNFDANIWGGELELDWRPLENLRVGFKGGYENTRLAKGSKAIDLMDRTAGMPDWILEKGEPTTPSNCIMPIEWALENSFATCEAYKLGTATWDAPNNGEGFTKNLSGNQLPNAPKVTATITADYTLPLPSDWLMTLHTDLYYQSEAWTRIFNDPGYDKLKAYNNINIAAIFSNEDAGWQVMAYVKNVLNKDNITGAFLNSDDTGLTTNVFLNEPRLYGIRATKNWTGSEWWSAHAHQGANSWYPFQVEFDGIYGRFSHDHDFFTTPTTALFKPDFPFPFYAQKDLDQGGGGGVKFTYAPTPGGWNASASVRYGRAGGEAEVHGKQHVPGGYAGDHAFYFDVSSLFGFYNFVEVATKNDESHVMADFMVGKEFGIGEQAHRLASSRLSAGLTYARFKSTSRAIMHGRPDLYWMPNKFAKYQNSSHMHRFNADVMADREFSGAGPAVSWAGGLKLTGDPEKSGQIDLDLGLGGRVLFGKQKTAIRGNVNGDYRGGTFVPDVNDITPPYNTPVDIRRTRSVAVPSVNANLGLAYSTGGVRISGGYKIERYFNAVDGGYTEHKSYDRGFDGPYFKVSVGFGG